MDVFSVFTLLGGLAFFIFGMNQMSRSLERIAGDKMELIINRMTRNRFTGLLLGCVITVAIQSSSAVTVMLVGLVNSGLMELSNTVGVIMGSNIGTTITAWIMSLIGVSSDNLILRLLRPENFSPLLAFIGIVMIMLAKDPKKKDAGTAFLGFAILMYGMIMMSGSVAPLADSPEFAGLLTAFSSPALGILTGLVVTAVIQSSAASVGMLQALSMTGSISFGMAIPIIMGQNIGTCATALLSSIGVGKNAKRVAAVHLSFNLIGTALFIMIFYGLHFAFGFDFMDRAIDPVGIALCHSVFNIVTTALLLPFTKLLVTIASRAVRTDGEKEKAFLDERLFSTPPLAVAECQKLSAEMCRIAASSVCKAIDNLGEHSPELEREIEGLEADADIYEDRLNTYLVRLSGGGLSAADNARASTMLLAVGNFERISDHSLNLVRSAAEIKDKAIEMSEQAERELRSLYEAIREIISMTQEAYERNDAGLASGIEPLEQVIDALTETIRMRHINRLQSGECTIEKGFVLADILTNLERVSDHCSNIAVAVMEYKDGHYDPHEYLKQVRDSEDTGFMELYKSYEERFIGSVLSEA